MACVEADGIMRFKSWTGPAGEAPHNPPTYRATKVFVRKDGAWRVVHSHFSVEGEGVRPDKAGNPAATK